MPAIVERWVSETDFECRSKGYDDAGVTKVIYERLKPLQELVSGYDFATVIARYFEGFQKHSDLLMSAALLVAGGIHDQNGSKSGSRGAVNYC